MKEQFIYIYNVFFKKYIGWLIGSFVISCGMSVLSLVEPTLNKYLIDEILGNRRIEKLIYVVGVFVALFVITNVFSYILQRININISVKSVAEIKQTIISKLQSRKASKTWEIKDDVLVSVTQDVAVITSFYSNVVLGTIVSVLYAILLTVYLMRYSILLTTVVLFTTGIQLLIYKHYAEKIRINVEEFKVNYSKEFGYLNSTISNIKLIRSYNYQMGNVKKYANILADFKNLTWKNFRITYGQSLLVNTVTILSNLVVIIYGVYLVLYGSMTLGIFVVFLSLCDNLKASLSSILSISVSIQEFRVALTRIYNLILDDRTHEIAVTDENQCNGDLVDENIKEIDLVGVKYDIYGTELYNGLNYKLERDKPVILVGDNGSGKSTLIDIIIKELNVKDGIVAINGRCIEDLKERDVNDRVAVAFQSNFFLKETIETNLKMGNENISREKIEEILRITNCNSFVSNLEKGLETVLDDSNNKLSGGELQRLSIARTLLKEADVYIFDEVFSNIDDNSKLVLFNNIVHYLSNKIVLFITHDEKIVENNKDKIWHLKNQALNKIGQASNETLICNTCS